MAQNYFRLTYPIDMLRAQVTASVVQLERLVADAAAVSDRQIYSEKDKEERVRALSGAEQALRRLRVYKLGLDIAKEPDFTLDASDIDRIFSPAWYVTELTYFLGKYGCYAEETAA